MSEQGEVVTIQDNYYRDCFGKVVFILCSLLASIGALVGISIYIFISAPPPFYFQVGDQWRIVSAVQVREPYLSDGDLLQWVSNVAPRLFSVDFLNIDEQLEALKPYFTDSGYQVFLNQFNNNVKRDSVMTNKLFVHATLTGAPIILVQNVVAGRYAWWVQFPISIGYDGIKPEPVTNLRLKVLVVRTEITNNLMGVQIDNMIVERNPDNQIISNG